MISAETLRRQREEAMTRTATLRSVPKPRAALRISRIPGTERRPFLHRCSQCPVESATWRENDLPRGWTRTRFGREVCGRCARIQP